MNNKLGKMDVDLGPYQRTESFQRINKDVRSNGTLITLLIMEDASNLLAYFHLIKSLWTVP